ncbi:hypothetical protein RHGRI_032075 [Rhododendron griersonianum]|uniref:Uncharacterized protein n=1 Tax=Rhododendron griersonianum TaxID=479676 RepID=A0AAV6IAA3_9ERIC|nr:hypothetical protein RHGRI_032075 [Rhododendron griersonianum]
MSSISFHSHFCHCGNRNSAIIGKATERISSAEWHALIFAKLGLLLDLIQIMYQNRSDSPFQTHPATMAISVTAICISGFAAAALLNSKAVKVEEEDKEEQQSTGKYFLYCRRILDMLVLISGIHVIKPLRFEIQPQPGIRCRELWFEVKGETEEHPRTGILDL